MPCLFSLEEQGMIENNDDGAEIDVCLCCGNITGGKAMNRYSNDYGIEFQSPKNRRPLTRAQAARVIAAPLPKRATGHAKAIALPLAIGLVVLALWALAFLIAFAS